MALPHVCIAMCTHNGAGYLEAQLGSFLRQTHSDWSLWVSDDASSDATLEIIAAFATANPAHAVHVFAGPARGSSANFLSLLARPGLRGHAVALADQDDVWFEDKLSHALSWLAEDVGPALYASRTVLTDAALQPIGPSVLHPRPPAFGNALVQNIMAGNTMLLNAEALTLLQAGLGATTGVRHHDWWIYLALSGAGARLFNDEKPGLFYRQHGGNVMGAHKGISGRISRAGVIASGEYARWNGANLGALLQNPNLLTAQNKALATKFANLRAAPSRRARWQAMAGLGVYRISKGNKLMLRLLAFAGLV